MIRRAKKSKPLQGSILADAPCKGNHTKGDALCISDSTTRPPEKKGLIFFMAAEKKIDDEIDDELFAMAIVDAKFQEWLENPTEIEGRKKILAKKYNVQEDAPLSG